MNELDTVTIAILVLSGFANVALVIWVFKLSIENRNVRFALYQREKWHEKEIAKWRERL